MKKTHKTTLGLAAAAVALLTGSAAAHAQDAPPQAQVIELVPGTVVLVTPDGPAEQRPAWQVPGLPMPGFTLPAIHMPAFTTTADGIPTLPDAVAMLQQIDRMMARTMQALDAAGPAMDAGAGVVPAAAGPGAPGQVAGVVVTSFSDGRTTCTERVLYPEGGGPARIEVSASGPGCAQAGFTAPAAQPIRQPPSRASAPTIEVKDRAPQRLAPMVLADAAG